MPNETTVASRAVLSFANADGQWATFSLPRANPSISVSSAMSAMEAMINTGALELRNIGPATAAKRARIISTTRTRVV